MLCILFILVLFDSRYVKSQCYQDSDISLVDTGYESFFYQAGGPDQCIANYTLLNEFLIDNTASDGIICSRKGSNATDGTWTRDSTSTVVTCGTNTGQVRCEQGTGSVTFYTLFNGAQSLWESLQGSYTCCIEGLCTSIRVYQVDFFGNIFPNAAAAVIESCTIIPPSDITAIPQQYIVQMNTSGVPPGRLTSYINCNDGNGITCGESYYTLIDLDEEKFQYSIPVTWSTNSTSNTDHYYSCRAKFGGKSSSSSNEFISSTLTTSIKAASAPTNFSYDLVNATAVSVSWSITGDVNGFIINISSSGLDTITEQLTNGSVRDTTVSGLLLERDYSVEVRGYYELLGPAGSTTVRLEADISSVNGSLLSVNGDLSSQQVQVNCYTFRVKPSELTWMINSAMIDSSYNPVTGSVLLDSADQTYRHYITLTGSFTDGTTISCNTNVSGEVNSQDYELEAASSPPTGLQATIQSSTSLSIGWTPLSDVNGYIIQYTGGQPVLVDGQDSSSFTIEGLTQGTTYQIDVYSYIDLLSASYSNTSVLFDVPSIMFSLQSTTPSSISITLDIMNSIVDNYTVSATRLCDSVTYPITTIDGSMIINVPIMNFTSGLEYSVSIVPVNILGKGMERTSTVTVQKSGDGTPSGAPLLYPPVTINSTSVMLSWNELNCTERNGIITGYDIQYNIDGGMEYSTSVTQTTSTVITGLIEFNLYFISVAAINNNGTGPYSQEYAVYTIDSTITDLSVQLSTTFALLSWPLLTNVTNVMYEYEVAYAVDSECSSNSVSLPIGYTVHSPRTSSDSIEVFGLMSGTCYVFGVRAYVSVSNSSGDFTTVNGGTVSDLIDSFVVQTSVQLAQLSWNTYSLNSPIDMFFYEVGYVEGCAGNSLPENYTSFVNTTNGSVEITGLEADTCYVFGVRAYSVRTGEPGEWNATARKTLRQAISMLPTQEPQDTTSVNLSWPPLVTETDDMFTYEVGYIARPDDTQCTDSNDIDTLPDGYALFGNTTDTSIIVTGLQPGTCYVFGVRVYAARSQAQGEWIVSLQQTLTEPIITSSSSSTSSISSDSSTTTTATTSTAGTEPPSADNAVVLYGAGAGGGIFLIVILVVIVLVAVLVLRRKSSRKSKTLFQNGESPVYQNDPVRYTKEQEYVEMDIQKMNNEKEPIVDDLYTSVDKPAAVPSFEANANIYANAELQSGSDGLYENPTQSQAQAKKQEPPYDPKIPETHPVPVDDFGRYVSEHHFNSNSGFKEQYKTLYTGEEKSCEVGQREEYKLLNRFKNITVYDDNRIVLNPLPISAQCTEFINAGYINGYSLPRKYIASQGPLPKTVGDFWHMVWQEKVRSIVMLTNLMEEKKKKCARYWPEHANTDETYGHFKVYNLDEEPLLNFVTRTLRVELIGTNESVIVKHYQYITWPDYGVPESVSPFMTLKRRVMTSWTKDKGPIIVHCSAGVGRTGTFIAVDMALEQAEKEKRVDIAGIVSRMRQQRMKMVQTDAQYAFVHDAVLESIMTGATEITCDLFEPKVMKWRQENSQNGKMLIQVQFELLSLVTPDQDDVLKQTAEKYPEKNRSANYLPPEKWRVMLKGEIPDYINAVFIDGYREKKAFIITQSPMESTVRDFWKMILDYRPSAIVMCCELMEDRQEVCFPYWDENGPVRFGDLVVEVLLITRETGFVKRDLKVTDDKNNSVTIAQFQFTKWPSSGMFTTPQTILDVIDFIGRVQRKSGKRSIVVHCSDTVGRSAMYCVASNAIEQCNIEGLVDVFQATKAVRIHKPGAVTSVEQYNLLHDIVQRYLDQYSAYSNFQNKN